jgi:hypothetical protein
MNAEEFAYWLQRAIEMSPEMLDNGMTPQQAKTIKDHLDLVFNKVTPDRFDKEDSNKPMTLRELRIASSGPSTGGSPLFCSDYQLEVATKTAIEAGKRGLMC